MRLPLLLTSTLLASVLATQAPAQDLASFFEGLDGTFVLLDGKTGETTRHNPARAARRFAPCSTFKVPHTMILLESGTVPGATEAPLTYDPALKQPPQWARDFNLQEAFKASALWYYRLQAQRLGMAKESRYVRAFGYGNEDTSGGIDGAKSPFWVDGSLRVSADEQVQFLRRFHENRLGLSARTTALTRQIMLVEETPAWRLSAKTGACHPTGEQTSNWYVGFVEKSDATYYFALQLGADDYGRAYKERVPLSRRILTALGILS
ncbi:MAG TPA: penicillin-binding transpeptidase domain-containing protein [Luteitalea sp.]|nr:penicillin-binding transpeptidase domain-containing protein [Luteitalea sp.]